MQEEHAHLFYREGSSDKVYQAHLVKEGSGFVVRFEFGRRGQTLQTGAKTASPVPYDKAKAIYDKLVKEKSQKGYTPDESGKAYVGTSKEEQVSGVLPQLLNPIEEKELEPFFKGGNFWMQEKFDGRRMMLQKLPNGTIQAINRKGLIVGFPAAIQEAALVINAISFILDGEAVGEIYHVFDCLEIDGKDIASSGYQDRCRITILLLGPLPSNSAVHWVGCYVSPEEKRKGFAQLRAANAEGVVFKDKNASYHAGRPNSGGSQVKYKFYATCSAVVQDHVPGKRSVELCLLDANGDEIFVGKVTIPANHRIPDIGKVAEIRYLYAYPGGALYQPVYQGERDDIDREACQLAQLKYKPKTESDEEDA
jgi:bifunctional non-homologous end joining protein LigD